MFGRKRARYSELASTEVYSTKWCRKQDASSADDDVTFAHEEITDLRDEGFVDGGCRSSEATHTPDGRGTLARPTRRDFATDEIGDTRDLRMVTTQRVGQDRVRIFGSKQRELRHRPSEAARRNSTNSSGSFEATVRSQTRGANLAVRR